MSSASRTEDSTDDAHIDALLKVLCNEDNPRKRKLQGDILDPYLRAGRWFPLSVDPFVDLAAVINAGMDVDGNKITQDMHDHYKQLYKMLTDMVPRFHNTLFGLRRKTKEMATFIQFLTSAGGDARSEDCGSLKHTGLAYIPRNPDRDVIQPPIGKEQGKSCRGFNHPATACLLCPKRYLDRFDNDPAFATLLKDGKFNVTTADWAAFLYDEDQNYDPNEKDKGLLRGHFLLRVYSHIFTSPASALPNAGRRGTKPSKSKLHNLTAPTPRTIAYAALQARLILSSCKLWGKLDHKFDNEKFFNNIIKLFEHDPEDLWCIETLAWWKEQVPGLSPVACAGVLDDEGDELMEVLAQRATRRRIANPDLEAHHENAVCLPVHSNHDASVKDEDITVMECERLSSLSPSENSADLNPPASAQVLPVDNGESNKIPDHDNGGTTSSQAKARGGKATGGKARKAAKRGGRKG